MKREITFFQNFQWALPPVGLFENKSFTMSLTNFLGTDLKENLLAIL